MLGMLGGVAGARSNPGPIPMAWFCAYSVVLSLAAPSI